MIHQLSHKAITLETNLRIVLIPSIIKEIVHPHMPLLLQVLFRIEYARTKALASPINYHLNQFLVVINIRTLGAMVGQFLEYLTTLRRMVSNHSNKLIGLVTRYCMEFDGTDDDKECEKIMASCEKFNIADYCVTT